MQPTSRYPKLLDRIATDGVPLLLIVSFFVGEIVGAVVAWSVLT